MQVPVALLFSRTGDFAQTEIPLSIFGRFCLDEAARLLAPTGIHLDIFDFDDEVFDCGSSVTKLDAVVDLLRSKGVYYYFGPYSSLLRRAAQSSIPHSAMLFYPTQYEGFDGSPNTWFFGGTPAQQVLPAIEWFCRDLQSSRRLRVAFVGSDYEYARTLLVLIDDPEVCPQIEIVCQAFADVPHTEDQIINSIQKITTCAPDLILNALNGYANETFFRLLPVEFDATPIVSFSLSESEAFSFKDKAKFGVRGTYLASNSFEFQIRRKFTSIIEGFARHWKASGHGQVAAPVTDTMFNLHSSIDLWRQALQDARGAALTDADEVLSFVRREVDRLPPLDSPHGPLEGDSDHHWKKYFFLGRVGLSTKIQEDGIVTGSSAPLAAKPHLSINAQLRRGVAIMRRELMRNVKDSGSSSQLSEGEVNFAQLSSAALGKLSAIEKSVEKYHDLDQIVTAYPCDTALRAEWRRIAIQFSELSISDRDIKEAISALLKGADTAREAYAAAKLRAAFYRWIPNAPSRSRVQLFDFLDFGRCNGQHIMIRAHKEDGPDTTIPASLDALCRSLGPSLFRFCWPYQQAGWQQLWKRFRSVKIRHAVEVWESLQQFVYLCEFESNDTRDGTRPIDLPKLLFADPSQLSTGEAGGFVAGIRALSPEVSIAFLPFGRLNQKAKADWMRDKFLRSSVLACECFNDSKSINPNGDSVVRLTWYYRGGGSERSLDY